MKQVAFITGASSGIGYELALELAGKGFVVALAARRKEVLDCLITKIEACGTKAIALACDVGDRAQVKQAVAETIESFGRIDLAILSAGISEPTDSINFNAEIFERMLRTNLLGVAYCLEALVAEMKRQGHGTIAAISSLAADRGIPGAAGYCATKAALTTLLDGMRIQLRNHGITLVTVEPGFVMTPMTEKVGRMPFVMRADAAARLIATRIEFGDRVIRFPFVPSAAMKLVRMLPVRLFDLIAAKRRSVQPEG